MSLQHLMVILFSQTFRSETTPSQPNPNLLIPDFTSTENETWIPSKAFLTSDSLTETEWDHPMTIFLPKTSQ